MISINIGEGVYSYRAYGDIVHFDICHVISCGRFHGKCLARSLIHLGGTRSYCSIISESHRYCVLNTCGFKGCIDGVFGIICKSVSSERTHGFAIHKNIIHLISLVGNHHGGYCAIRICDEGDKSIVA